MRAHQHAAAGRVRQTVSTQQSACCGAFIQQSPLPRPQSPQPVITKRVKLTSSLFTCTIVRHRQAPCPTTNGQYM